MSFNRVVTNLEISFMRTPQDGREVPPKTQALIGTRQTMITKEDITIMSD
jgi:hypothetical protein